MRKFVLLTTLLFSTISFAQNKDSLAHIAVEYAAHSNIAALRPLNKKMGKHFPHHVQLFCEMAIARSEGRYKKMVECIDSLRLWYPKQIQTKTQLSLGELKAEGLRQMGEYKKLHQFCKDEIKILKRKGLRTNHLKELYHYQEKAARLLGNDKRSQLLQLVDRKLIYELDSLYNYNKEREHVDEFTHLRCEVTLSKAFHRDTELLTKSKALVQNFKDSLDTEELSTCIKAHADILIMKGAWEDLGAWAKYIKSIKRRHTAPITVYDKLSKKFSSHPRFHLERPSGDYVLNTSYEWPLLLQGSVNNSDSIGFILTTDQPYSLISEEVAQQQQVETINDTLLLSTTHGFIEVSPAWIKQISLGKIHFLNVFAYVVHSSNDIPAQMSNVIGLNEMMALGKITFLPERLLISDKDKGNVNVANNQEHDLYISAQNGLYIHATDLMHKTQPLNFDISCPNNILTKKCFTESRRNKTLAIYIGDSQYTINRPVWVEPKSLYYNGILGVPFLRNFEQVTLDFNQMKFKAIGKSSYVPVRGKFSYETNKFYLARNEEALSTGLIVDPEETQFLRLLIALGKSNREKAAAISKKLREAKSDFYNPYTEGESLFMCGKYQEACQLLQGIINGNFPWNDLDEIDHNMLKSLLSKCQFYQNEHPLHLTAETSASEYECENGTTDIRVNNKKTDAVLDFCCPMTEISAKTAKKKKVKILGKQDGATYGIISKIELGDFTLENVPCIILTDKVQYQKDLPLKRIGIRLGSNALSAFKQVKYLPHTTIYSTHVDNNSQGANLSYTNHWNVETTTKGGYATFCLTNNSNVTKQNLDTIEMAGHAISTTKFEKQQKGEKITNCISIPYLVSKFGAVTLNIENMKLQLK